MRRSERELGALLEDVSVDFPDTPDLAGLVRRRIESGPAPVETLRLPRTRPPALPPVLVAASVVVLALAVTLALSVTARRAVADLLGVVGIHITFDDEADVSVEPRAPLRLGEPASIPAASERARFDVLVPSGDRRWAVYYDPAIGSTGMVSLVYPHDARSTKDVDLLVTQFVASIDGTFFKKVGLEGGDVMYVDVRSAAGFWIGGEHVFYYAEANGEPREETVRLAGKVLLWEEDGVTFRVEGAGTRRAALEIARSLR